MILAFLISTSILFAVDSSSTQVKTDFDVALKMADSNLKLPGGEQYDEDFGRSCGPWLADEMVKCTSGLDSMDLKPFTFLFRIGTSGDIEEMIFRPNTKVAECLKSSFKMHSYPKPPSGSWWVKVNISTTE
jgi:hypothetical protein